MRISRKHKFIFFSNPKTGSSSLRQFLDPYSDVFPVKNYLYRSPDNLFYPHMTPREVQELFNAYKWDFDRYHKFVVVRNPWARLVSLFEHIKREDKHLDFKTWLKSVSSNGVGGGGENWQRWRRYGTWSIKAFTSDSEGKILVDKILRFEDLDQLLIPHLQEIGLDITARHNLQHKNAGSYTRHYSEYYCDETTSLVERKYRYDIDNFNYQFV